MKWIVVYQARTVMEAESIRLLLMSFGLDVRIWDSHLGALNPWIAHALGGMRVVVPGDQAEKARDIIFDHDRGGGADAVPTDELEREALSAVPPAAPRGRTLTSSDRVLILLIVIFGSVALVGLSRFLDN